VISLNLVLAGLRLGLKNRQVGEKWVSEAKLYKYFTYAGILYYEVSPINWTLIFNSTRYFSCQQSFLGLRDLCINRHTGKFFNRALLVIAFFTVLFATVHAADINLALGKSARFKRPLHK
jgi:hypothetical protein